MEFEFQWMLMMQVLLILGEWLSRLGRYRGDDKVMRNGKLFGNQLIIIKFGMDGEC